MLLDLDVMTFHSQFQIIRLIYTNSGASVLALAYNAVHKLWKWQRNERNLMGKVLIYLSLVSFSIIMLFSMRFFLLMHCFFRRLQVYLHSYGNLLVEY